MTAHVNAGGWKSLVNLYVKVGTTLGPFSNGWRTVSNGYVNSGGWRSFFTSAPTPSIVSAVTISRNNAAYPSTLTGTNRFWTNSTSLTYVFQKSSDGTNWSDIGSPTTIQNPSSGSTNTVTYALTTKDMPAYTSYYRFSVTAVNSTYSTTKTSNSTSVTVTQPAPVNAIAPLVTPSTGTPGVTTYSTTNGDWDIDDADGIYAYQWQYYSGIAQNIPGATSSTYSPPSNYVTLYGTELRCRVTATNATGSTSVTNSNSVTVGVALPSGGTITLTPSGTQYSGTLLTATTSGWSGSPTSYSVRIYGSTFNPPDTSNLVKASSSTASATYTITNGDATPPILYFKAFATATNASGTSIIEVESNVVTSKLPSASALAVADTTITPGTPSSITVTNTAVSNEGKVTWTNGSDATTAWVSSVTPGSSYTGTDGGSKPTSQTFSITSSATAVATVNNKNLQKKATVSWTQDGAASYSANITISGSSLPINGTSNVTGSTSGSSGSFDVVLSTGGGTVKVNSITVYTKASQTGGSFTFTPATGPSVTPTDKTSTATGSGLIYRAPANSVAPTLNTTSGTAGVTTFSVSNNGTWSPDDADGVYEYQWQYLAGNPQNLSSAAEVARGSTTSSYSPSSNYVTLYGSSLRCRVTATNPGGTGEAFSNVATVSPLGAAYTPTFSATTSLTTSSFSGSINNYSALYTWSFATSAGTVTPGTPSAGNYVFTVTGLTAGQSATVTVTTTRTGYADGTGTSTGNALNAALTPTFGTNTSTDGGFTGSVTNYNASYTWNTPSIASGTLTAGTFTWGTASGSTRPFTITNLNSQQSSTVTITTTRTGYASGSADTTGTGNLLAPINAIAPTITPSTGQAGVTEFSVNSNGTWDPVDADGIYQYQWQYFDGTTYQNLSFATSSTYTPAPDYINTRGTTIRCRVTATNARGSTNAFSSNSTVTPSASNLATSDSTLTPGTPSSITVANTATTNQGSVTWTNGSNATSSWVSSVTPGSSYTGTDGGSLLTSQVFTITSSATAVATVNNKNNNKRVTVSWDQASSASYSVNYTITNAGVSNGTYTSVGNSTASSASFVYTFGNVSGTLRANSVTLYSGANQTGVSSTFTPATAPSTSPTDKTSSNTGSGTVNATPINLVAPALNLTSGTAGTTQFSVNNGTWDKVNLNTVFTYQWQYYSGIAQNIPSATSSTYTPPSNYVTLYGTSLRCLVKATNVGGLFNSEASNVATVSPPPIIPAGSVSVSGSLTLNSLLECSVANVTGAVSYTYQWYYGFTNAAGSVQMNAVSSTLTLGSGDVPNQYFKCVVVATSSTGNTTTFTSNVVGPTYKAPNQVTGVTATVTSLDKPYNQGEIGVSWTAPADNGSAITGYFVESSSNGGSTWSTFAANWTGGTGFGSSPWVVGTYIFRVSAINAAGTGTASANSNNAVVTTVPQAPTIGTATAGNGQATVSYTAGATGGSAITGFSGVSSPGGFTSSASSSGTPMTFTGLTNGTSYTFTVTATNANGTSVASSASNSVTPAAPVSPPANTSQPTLSGNLSVGSTLTFGVGSWSGSPTSYDLRLYRGTQFVAISETLAKNAGNVTSSTYVITQADFNSAQKYFRAFASATNAGGTSSSGALTAGQEVGPITAAAAPATAPGIPGTPTNGWTSGLSYPFSWTAATPGTVSGGGAATISSYQIRIYKASSSSGTGATLYNTYTSSGSGTSYTFTAPDSLYYAASVSATNSAGLSSSSYSGISVYK